MFRRHWQTLAGLAGLGLVVGCSSMSDRCSNGSDHRLLQRFRNRNVEACCPEMSLCGEGGGNVIYGEGPVLPQPTPGVMETPLGTPTPITQPPPANGQRLVPQPQPPVQPTPFNPTHARQP